MKALKALTALGALGVVAVTPMTSDAQACLGLPSFSAGGVQLGLTGERAKDDKGIGVGLTFGSPAGAFGGPSLVSVSYDDFGGNTIVVGGSVGWQIPVDAARRIQLCPGLGAARGFGPDDIDNSGSELSTHSALFGLQLGVVTGTNPQVYLVPTFGAALSITRAELDGGVFDGAEESDIYGILTFGVGLVVRSRVSIRPSVELPLGLEDGDPSVGIIAAINF